MRDHLVLYVNGARRVIRGNDALLSLSDFLRGRLGLIGTKIVCSEGDCGACSVLVGRLTNGSQDLVYRPIDSCIAFLFQLDGAHIVTVEGLRPDGALNAVQRAMIDCHGSQCGFCTPGFVVAMTGLLEENGGRLDEHGWRQGLTGNLCRCTGYTPILDAAIQACNLDYEHLNVLYPPGPIAADLAPLAADSIEIQSDKTQGLANAPRVACPASLRDALAFLAANPTATIIAGATDVGVRVNKTGRLPPLILDLNHVAELDGVRRDNNALVAGARATWTTMLAACTTAAPEFARILAVFGAPQIRHVGTLGGNIANGSPIADALPFLYVMEATLVLATASGRRRVNINDFYRGYKQRDLRPGELIAEVHIPLPAPGDTLRLYKVSRRRDLDIATFTAAIRLRIDSDTIAAARIALGGVGPTVCRAREAEQYLAGRPFSEETMRTAGDRAAAAITPLSDVRGAAHYRRQLARKVFVKFYHQAQAPSNAPLHV